MSDLPSTSSRTSPEPMSGRIDSKRIEKTRDQKRKRLIKRYAKHHPQDILCEKLNIPQDLMKPLGFGTKKRKTQSSTESDRGESDIADTVDTEKENVQQRKGSCVQRIADAVCSANSSDSMIMNDESIRAIDGNRNPRNDYDNSLQTDGNLLKSDEKSNVDTNEDAGIEESYCGQRNDDRDSDKNVNDDKKFDGRTDEDSDEDVDDYDDFYGHTDGDNDEYDDDYDDIDALITDGDSDEDVDNDEDRDDCDVGNDDSDNEGKIFSINNKIDVLLTTVKLKSFVTNLTILLQTLASAVRHNWTYSAIITMLQSLSSILVQSSIPRNMKSLWKLLSRNDEIATTRHYYCEICLDNLGTNKTLEKDCACGRCGPNKDNRLLCYFIHLKIEPQIRQLLSDASIVESLAYRFSRRKQVGDANEDIYDGNKYKKLCEPGGFLSYKFNFSFGLFTDGCKLSNSSKASAWPVMLMINEFSPHARKRYMLLAGIWVGSGHTDVHGLLMPIIKELNTLYTTGIIWTNPIDQSRVTSKFITVICTADTVARSMILNMTKFNGDFGCTFCYHRGEHIAFGLRGRKRIYRFERVPSNCRTDADIRRDIKLAIDINSRVNGVIGYSSVACLKGFDLGSGVPVDSMHNVYLGVAKFHTSLFIEGPASKPWYFGSNREIQIIDDRLMKLRPPSKISRKPRSIEEYKHWKASEWRNWIQFYALSCLKDVISDQHHKHLALLCNAVYILNKSCISADEIEKARQLITKYIEEFENLFGRVNMRYNLHLLSHLTDSVQNWGPFWTHSAFPYESYNRKIVEKVTSANSRPLQIVTRFLLTRFIESMLSNSQVDIQTKKAINATLTRGLKKQAYVIDSTPLVPDKFQGLKYSLSREPNASEVEAFRIANYDPPLQLSLFKRAFLNGSINYEIEKTSKTRYCDEYIYCESIEYGRIIEIITFRDTENKTISGFLIQKLEKVECAFNTDHIHIVTESTKTFLPLTDDVLSSIVPAITLGTLPFDRVLISRLPNVNETD